MSGNAKQRRKEKRGAVVTILAKVDRALGVLTYDTMHINYWCGYCDSKVKDPTEERHGLHNDDGTVSCFITEHAFRQAHPTMSDTIWAAG